MAGPSQEVFRVNCTGTYNVYQAAAEEGIGKLACASSINALGFNFGIAPFEIQYFPVDEAHPTCTTDAYSFSKQVVEEIGAYFWRREGISSVSLRLPAVYEAQRTDSDIWKIFAGDSQQALTAFLDAPPEERRASVARALAQFDATRRLRATYDPSLDLFAHWQGLLDDPDLNLLLSGFGHSNFWTSIDARDSAQAFEKGLTAEYQGHHPLYVNDSENAAGVDSEPLARAFFPDVTARTHALQGRETLVSIDRARALIGFEPQYHISDVMGYS
jgi:hypothetical protein